MESLILALPLAIVYAIVFTTGFFLWLWRNKKKQTMTGNNDNKVHSTAKFLSSKFVTSVMDLPAVRRTV